jgi:hypothetical protein
MLLILERILQGLLYIGIGLGLRFEMHLRGQGKPYFMRVNWCKFGIFNSGSLVRWDHYLYPESNESIP